MGHYFLDRQHVFKSAQKDFKYHYLIFKNLLMYVQEVLTHFTVCPRSSDRFYVVTDYIKLVTTSWTYSRESCIQGVKTF